MPEYLAPGVYVEEVSFRAKSIEGVSTTTTGFVGPCRYGPIHGEPDVITSLVEFERVYGDRDRLTYGSDEMHNFMWHAARCFFEEGGKRLYVARVYQKDGAGDGIAKSYTGTLGNGAVGVKARFPGAAGNLTVRLSLRFGQNVLAPASIGSSQGTVRGLVPGDLVYVQDLKAPIASPPNPEPFYLVAVVNNSQNERELVFRNPANPNATTDIRPRDLNPDLTPGQGDRVVLVTLAVTVMYPDGNTLVWEGLAPQPGHRRDGAADSIFARFGEPPDNLAAARTLPIIVEKGSDLRDAHSVVKAIFGTKLEALGVRSPPSSLPDAIETDLLLTGGSDGLRPELTEYQGSEETRTHTKSGLLSFEDIEDISIIAAPGSTKGYENGYRNNAISIANALISHAQRMRYRIAVIDSGDGQSIQQVRAMRAKLDSTYAAFYYPWVRVLDPVTRAEINLPPSGFVAGIYARNDINRAVYKAPANEVVNLALGFETMLNKSQQDVLNPEGINCFRFFEGRGNRLWGARTASSDPEWKYVNLRRYFIYLERSIDRSTQWAVFEPNGEALWANIRRTVEDFLLNEWMSGALLGDKPEKAYFVKCDRSTMTQNDLDNGRMICLIGVAALRPAEFVIFRIGQWTSDRKV